MEISIELETCVVKDTMGIKRKASHQNPETLEGLCNEELQALAPGDFVKICYEGKTTFWVKLLTYIDLGIEDDACDAVCIGVVDNVPVNAAFQLGERIKFTADQIVEVYV